MKDVKAQTSIRFVRYTDMLSEIPDKLTSRTEKFLTGKQRFRDAAADGFRRPDFARPDNSHQGEPS
ncbi:hypothetical protein MPLSOD_100187 [Mesorhizobium sp. SOD10]|nr:hypothetical protein MPLSOD_100187 [Mesorhizobium sp. SOD10]